jgi:hypothetical protein
LSVFKPLVLAMCVRDAPRRDRPNDVADRFSFPPVFLASRIAGVAVA